MLRPTQPRAVVFDLDGVLLDTEELYTQATLQVVAPFGKTYPFELKVKMMGRGALESAHLLLSELGIPLTAEDYLEQRARILRPLFAQSKPMPGAEASVRWLHSMGIPLAVATSSNRELFQVKTSHHEWFQLFDVVVCGDDSRLSRPKPAPDIFLLAARELGFDARECVAVEDSPSGAEAAVRAQMTVVAIPDPRLDRALLPQSVRIEASLDVGVFERCLDAKRSSYD